MLTRDAAPPPMTLSTAIRLGAMLKPQGFGMDSLFGGRTCALGAAADSLSLPDSELRYSLLRQTWSQLQADIACPMCADTTCNTLGIMYHLNDMHRWTRERIADFVAGLEAAQATERPSEADACCSTTSVPLSVR